MRDARLNEHYQRLYRMLGGQPADTTLQQLADGLCCTRRHMRNLLQRMQANGWIVWQARVGRGERSHLEFVVAAGALQRERAIALLAEGRIEQAAQLLGDDRQALEAAVRARLGRRWDRERQVLAVPYYRPLGNLVPGTPLRRSERHLVGQIFNGLTRINEEKEEIEADLAHHWYCRGPLEWHFHLRPAVRWHDGKPLAIEDVVATIERLRTLPLYAHIRSVQALSPHTLALTLSEPDTWLLWLLADSAAMVLPADHAARPGFAAQPVGTGPYRVERNDRLRLRLAAFDDYFGYRALLDAIEIWVVPTFHPPVPPAPDPCRLQVQVNPGAGGGDDVDMALEQGCHFLLCDGRQPWLREPAVRAALARLLSPLALADRLPGEVRQYWTPAASLLPAWFHRPPDADAEDTAARLPSRLRLAFPAQQPEYRAMAQAMADALGRHGVTVECRCLDFGLWEQGEGDADLWLGSVNFSAHPAYSVAAWLLGTPLLRHCLEADGVLPLSDWHSAWRAGALDAQQLTAHIVRPRWLMPLFHSWFRLRASPQMQDLRLNSLGWFDFKTAWLAP